MVGSIPEGKAQTAHTSVSKLVEIERAASSAPLAFFCEKMRNPVCLAAYARKRINVLRVCFDL